MNHLPLFRMLDELEGPGGRASREFRQKFPDEIVTDNLGGQVIFSSLRFDEIVTDNLSGQVIDK